MKFPRCAVAAVLLLTVVCGCKIERRDSSKSVNPLSSQLQFPGNITRKDGIAAAILLDTSGSMRDRLNDVDGQSKPKLAIALMALQNLVRQMEGYSQKNPDRPVMVGIYEFSTRDNEDRCRVVLPLGIPDLQAARTALHPVKAEGGTPIGDAMIAAKRDLDATGLSRRHILVITDGENNRGYSPGDVANAISRLPEEDRVAIYFIAFDTSSDHFSSVKEAGGLLLSASSESDLNQTLDFVLTGKILAEAPVNPAR
jgi:hypothetical protein